jgi:hypothetical protein
LGKEMSLSQKVIRWVLSAIFFCDGGYGIVSERIFARTHGGDHSGIIEGSAARVLGIVFVGIAAYWCWQTLQRKAPNQAPEPTAQSGRGSS